MRQRLKMISRGIFATALALMALAVGGVHGSVVAVGGMMVAVATALLLVDDGDEERLGATGWISAPALGFAVLGAWSLLQAVPLPPQVFRLLSPHSWEVWEQAAELAGIDADVWRPMTTSVAATVDRAARFAVLLGVALFASNHRPAGGWRWTAWAIVGVSGVVALVGGWLSWTQTTEIFGWSTAVGFRAPSTFVNTNHGAAFFAFVVLLSGCLVAADWGRKPVRVTGWAAIAIAALLVTLAHTSDGTNLALGLCAALGASLWLHRRSEVGPSRQQVAVAGVLGALGVVAAWWLDLHRAVVAMSTGWLAGDHGNRFALAAAGAEGAVDHWLCGAGAGTVQWVLPRYLDFSRVTPGTIPFVENDSVELALTMGLPLALAVHGVWALAFLVILRRAWRPDGRLHHQVATVAAAFAAMILQLHFPLFALGLGAMFVAFLESAIARRRRPQAGRRTSMVHVWVGRRGLGTVVVAIAATLLVAAGSSGQPAVSRDSARDELVSALSANPSDHRIYVWLGTEAARGGDAALALRYAERAFVLNPVPGVRLYRARMLAAAGRREEAAVEYRVLFGSDPSPPGLVDSLRADFRSERERAEILVVDESSWRKALDRMAAVEGNASAANVALELAELRPESGRANLEVARRFLSMGQLELAELWAMRVAGSEAEVTAGALAVRVSAARRRGADGEALKLVQQATTAMLESEELAGAVLSPSPGRDWGVVAGAHERLCRSPVPQVRVPSCWVAEGEIAAGRGDDAGALTAFRKLAARGSAIPLAQYLLRSGRCGELRKLAAGARLNEASTIKVLADRCEQ